MSRSRHLARIIIDSSLVGRLESLAGAAVARFPEVADSLLSKLASARLVPSARLPAGVVTIGSELSYRDLLTGRDHRVTLAWPEQADISRGIISVLTPIGATLLGLSAGDGGRWITRAGEVRALTVLQVTAESSTIAKV